MKFLQTYGALKPCKSSHRFFVQKRSVLYCLSSLRWVMCDASLLYTVKFVAAGCASAMSHELQPWFAGAISRQGAADHLQSSAAVCGDYLVRQSENTPGAFVISVRCVLSPIHARTSIFPDPRNPINAHKYWCYTSNIFYFFFLYNFGPSLCLDRFPTSLLLFVHFLYGAVGAYFFLRFLCLFFCTLVGDHRDDAGQMRNWKVHRSNDGCFYINEGTVFPSLESLVNSSRRSVTKRNVT